MKVGSEQGASVKWPSGVGPCAGRNGLAPRVQSWVCTPARPRGDFRSGVPLFLPGPPEPSSWWSSRWRSFLTWPWLRLSVPSVHPPTSTTPSWRWLAPTLSLADPATCPQRHPSPSPVPGSPWSRQPCFTGVSSLTWPGAAFLLHGVGDRAQWPQNPEDMFATLDLDPEVFGQGLCCVYP